MNYTIYPGIMNKFQENYKGIDTFDDDVKVKAIVLSVITSKTGISITQIFSTIRLAKIREARQMIHFFLKRYTSMTWREIGVVTRNHHASVMHSVKTINNGIEYDQRINRKISSLDTEILRIMKNELS